MKFDKKIFITIVSTVAGVIVLGGIISLIAHTHGRFEGRGFEKGFGNIGCNTNFVKGNQVDMMSGLDNIITTKDYAAFKTLFSGSRMLEQINTPEKFATRAELQTTMKTAEDLQTQLGSGSKGDFGPMMFGGQKGGREGGRGNMMRRR